MGDGTLPGKKEIEAHQNQVIPLAGSQKRMIVLVGRHLLQDDACRPGELDEAPLVVPVLRILFPGLPCEFRGAQPMLEVLIGVPQVLARLVSKLGNRRGAGFPLWMNVPSLLILSVGIRISSISVWTGLAGRCGVSKT